jgi:amino acid transporter
MGIALAYIAVILCLWFIGAREDLPTVWYVAATVWLPIIAALLVLLVLFTLYLFGIIIFGLCLFGLEKLHG